MNADADINELFRRNLFRLMAEKDMSAAQLSKRANMNARAVKDIEEGRSKSPKLSTAKKLADGLGVTLDYLLMPEGQADVHQEVAALLETIDRESLSKVLVAIRALS